MRKQFLLLALFLVSVTGLWAQTATAPTVGDGSESSPYEIASLDNLYWLSENSNVWGDYFIQTADIDASASSTWDDGAGFNTIGEDGDAFTGSYNGKGYTIKGLSINRPSSENIGLFGECYGALDSIGLINTSVIGGSYVGALVGYAPGVSIGNCYNANGYVEGVKATGGLIGYTAATSDSIHNCYSGGLVVATGDYTGGLIGWVNTSSSVGAEVDNCYSTCNIIASGNYVAGLVGRNKSGTDGEGIFNCYYAGSITYTGTSSDIGPLQTSSSFVPVNNAYYNVDINGVEDNNYGEAKTTAELMQQATFVVYDFTDTWTITEGETYPRLKAVVNGPIMTTLDDVLVKVDVLYTSSVSVLKMDNSDITFSVAQGPDGMTITQAGVIEWTPTVAGSYAVEISVIDGNELGASTSYTIAVTDLIGSGTEVDPFEISSLDDLKVVSEDALYWSSYYKQTADINAAATMTWNDSVGFSPIGNDNTNFTGGYNGQGYSIDSLYINRPSESYVGLFGKSDSKSIGNLAITNCSVTGSSYVGGLAGDLSCESVSNTYVAGSVTGTSYVGGLTGYHRSGDLTVSYATSTVIGNGSVGGLVGKSIAPIYYCYSTGRVEGLSDVGGLVGVSEDTVAVSFYNGETSGQSDDLDKGTPKTILQLQQQSTYTGWDFTNTWAITESYSLPRLKSLVNGPVIMPVPNQIRKNNAQIIEAFQVIGMDNETVTIELLDAPEGTVLNTNVFIYTPNQLGQYDINIKVTDGNGKVSAYSYYYQIITLTGDGSTTSPYEIAKLSDLKELSEMSLMWDKTFIQTTDIDASATSSWDSTGFYPIANSIIPFTGSYNGKDYTIDGLSITREDDDYVGLFGYANGAKIDSVTIKNCNIVGADNIGGLAGGVYNNTIISNSSVTGTVSGDNSVGGLVGDIESSSLTNCYVTGSVVGYKYTGGIAGYLVGVTIDGCYSTGNVTGENYYIGGLTGYTKTSTISTSYSTSNVSSDGDYVGGLVGYLYGGTLTKSYATGSVFGDTYVGGLVGRAYTDSETTDCYSLGSVEGTDNYIGGLIGYLYKGAASNCYSTGTVSGDDSYVGGLLGRKYSSSTTLTSSYYNSEVSGQDDTGKGDPKTTAELMQEATFVDWDFTSTWGIKTGTYPALNTLNNAPVAFDYVDTLDVKGNISLDTFLSNDYDYETGQTALVSKFVNGPGTCYDNKFSFNYGTEVGTEGTIIYRVGELIAEGDTLWGGIAQAILTQVENTAPVLTAVAALSTNENTPITITMADITATDADGDMLYPFISEGANFSTVSPTTIVPDEGFYGELTVAIRATDGNKTSSELLDMTITVVAVPDEAEITWNAPETVSYGSAIGAGAQNATTTAVGTITYNFTADQVFDAGSHELIATFTPTVSNDYMAATDTVIYVVETVMLTATANDVSMIKGAAVPDLTISYSGFVNNETESVLDVAPTVSTTATSSSDLGTYPITLADGSDVNYEFTYVDGTMTISGLSVDVTTLDIAANETLTATFDITSDLAWTVASSESWLTADPASGNSNATVTLTAEENSGALRTATITVSADGVTDQTITVTQGGVGINNEGISNVTVYPNPASNLVYVTNVANATVQIFDVTGQLVFTKVVVSDFEPINVSEFNKGIYIINISNDKGAVTKRLVIE
jgi:hypothetical protein